MELQYVKLLSALGLLVITFFSAMLPLFWFKKYRFVAEEIRRDNLRLISFFSCFGGGVFLGTCLLHLFPDVQEQMDLIFKDVNIVPNYPVAEFLFGFGFLMILIVEQIAHNCEEHGRDVPTDTSPVPILNQDLSINDVNRPLVENLGTQYGSIGMNSDSYSHEAFSQGHSSNDVSCPLLQDTSTQYGSVGANLDSHSHEIVFARRRVSNSILRSLFLAFALSLHSIFEGLAIGLQTTVQSDFRILIAVLIHKCIIAFTLGISLINSRLRKSNMITINFCFSLASPFGIILGILVIDFVQGLAMVITSGILQGIAAGTFLYITVFEVLQKELKSSTDSMVKVACIVLGYSIVSLLLTFLPE
ncbi:Zinc transporter ZIP3 like protein [Argiope bruennichi]|uniref:Zinc transporter ZIP3 like protein n=1 Tax=Argiope bruennichi TaxID=94029 RepID=A0A8T0ET56_ARGBR|nr:Zinc transporter ZIP3 like protein [Argiope bruennichi]